MTAVAGFRGAPGTRPGAAPRGHDRERPPVMPGAKPTRRRKAKCPCGCGQAPAATTRLRKAECVWCGYIVRLSRDCIARGLPGCPCGGTCEPVCLHDRVIAPCAVGDAAYSELCARDDEFARRSEQMKKRAPQHRCPDCQTFRRVGAGLDPTNPEPCTCGSTAPAIRPRRKSLVDTIPF